jgi:hypothetical protein
MMRKNTACFSHGGAARFDPEIEDELAEMVENLRVARPVVVFCWRGKVNDWLFLRDKHFDLRDPKSSFLAVFSGGQDVVSAGLQDYVHADEGLQKLLGLNHVFFFGPGHSAQLLVEKLSQVELKDVDNNLMKSTGKTSSISDGINFSGWTRDVLKDDLKTAAELLTKIEAKLASSFQREIHKQDIPVLLFPHPSAVLDKKHNINVYLAFGFRTVQDPVKRARLVAFQIVSDYCLGLELSELQKDKIYNGFQFEAIASDIEELLKPNKVLFLHRLLEFSKMMKGCDNLLTRLDE